jgi:hypothetical protein
MRDQIEVVEPYIFGLRKRTPLSAPPQCKREDGMNMRVRQLWAPVLSTFLVSVSLQFVALRVPQLPPWVSSRERKRACSSPPSTKW